MFWPICLYIETHLTDSVTGCQVLASNFFCIWS